MTIGNRYVELHPGSQRLAARAADVFPNGVTHDIRHTTPFSLYAREADGSRKTDVDGNELIDYVMGHGALLLGGVASSACERGGGESDGRESEDAGELQGDLRNEVDWCLHPTTSQGAFPARCTNPSHSDRPLFRADDCVET